MYNTAMHNNVDKRQSLKFEPELVELIKLGKKWTTWRLFNDKELKIGQEIDLIARPELEVFARAKIISMEEKTLGTLNEIDRDGHGPVGTIEEMYTKYRKYYKRQVDSNTGVLVIKFQIIQELWH